MMAGPDTHFSPLSMTSQHRLIDGLKRYLASGNVEVSVRETHISWILLAGEFAWKIKKEVDFGFLDFSSLALRKKACQEELRLNKRFAPEIYLKLVAISGSPEHPVPNGKEAPIEYAVLMQRFDESGLLSSLADQGLLKKAQVYQAARRIADFHLQAAVAEPGSQFGAPDRVHHWLSESITHIGRLLESSALKHQIERVNDLSGKMFLQLEGDIRNRNRDGFVRECHGDLHLGNMVWIDQELIPFDCIEFNPGLRWIDVISEAAFVMMDLEDRGYAQNAWVFINTYLSHTGDYPGLRVLRYYLVYRALVRAKVTLLQRDSPDRDAPGGKHLLNTYLAYAHLAERWLTERRPVLLLMHGLSASGKSTFAARLAERHACIHLRSDVERKRLHGLSELENSHAGINSGIYSATASDQTYQHLYDCARQALRGGYPMIVDAAFLARSRRETFRQLAEEVNCPFLIVHCEADQQTLEARIKARAKQGKDPSEATLAILHKQIAQQDKLGADENQVTVCDPDKATLPRSITDITGYTKNRCDSS